LTQWNLLKTFCLFLCVKSKQLLGFLPGGILSAITFKIKIGFRETGKPRVFKLRGTLGLENGRDLKKHTL
jgi:hypothetical protein